MKFVSIALPVLLVVAIGLAGCDKSGKPAETTVSPAAMNSPELEDASSVKLDLYTQAYYLLMNSPDSLRPSYDSFHRVRKAKIADDIRFSPSGGLENGLELFKKGLAIHDGNMPDLDEAVRDALMAGSKLQKDEHALEPYFQKQEYREDRLAKAKAFYPSIQADYEVMFAHLEKIEALLFKYRKVQSEKRMAGFREKTTGWDITRKKASRMPRICWPCSANRTMRSKMPTFIPEATTFWPDWNRRWPPSARLLRKRAPTAPGISGIILPSTAF